MLCGRARRCYRAPTARMRWLHCQCDGHRLAAHAARARRRGRRTRSPTRCRRWRASTSSPATSRWSRRPSARAPAGCASAPPRSGAFVGGEPQQLWGRLANENKPVLRTHDRYGNRIDEVEFHPAWHQLMKMGVEHELHSLPWTSDRALRAHRARGPVHDRDAGRGRLRLPDHDDLRGRARAARPARAGGRVGAAGDRHHAMTRAWSRPARRARRSRAWR